MQTHATAIAVLEARRNEEQTLAEGALLGECRSSCRGLVGMFYTLFAIVTILVLRPSTR